MPSASSSAIARGVSPSPQVLSRGKTAASARTTSCPARAAQAAAADPAGPAPTTRTSVSAGTALTGTPPSVPGAGAGSAEEREAAGPGTHWQPVGRGQRPAPGAPPGRGDVVPPVGQRRSEQTFENPPDLGKRFFGGTGAVQPEHQVQMVDGGFDGERGEEIGHRQRTPLRAD